MSAHSRPAIRTYRSPRTQSTDSTSPIWLTRPARDAMSPTNRLVAQLSRRGGQGGFGAATLAPALSQSRVSAHIARWSTRSGWTLFDRKARPICNDTGGGTVPRHAWPPCWNYSAAVEAVRSTLDNLVGPRHDRQLPQRQLDLPCPQCCRSCRPNTPGVTVDLHEGNAATLEEMVAAEPSTSLSGAPAEMREDHAVPSHHLHETSSRDARERPPCLPGDGQRRRRPGPTPDRQSGGSEEDGGDSTYATPR